LFLLIHAIEHRIRKPNLTALSIQKRQIALIQIVRPVPNHKRIQRDNQHFEPVLPRATQHTRRELLGLRLRPVQLEPPVPVTVRSGYLLNRPRARRTQYHRDLNSRTRARSRFLGVWMHNLLDTYRRYEYRAAILSPEELDGHVSPRRLDEHRRPESVVVECGEIGSVGGLAACGPKDVEEVWLWDGCAGGGFPLRGLGGVFWLAEAGVDLALVLDVGVGVGLVVFGGFVGGVGHGGRWESETTIWDYRWAGCWCLDLSLFFDQSKSPSVLIRCPEGVRTSRELEISSMAVVDFVGKTRQEPRFNDMSRLVLVPPQVNPLLHGQRENHQPS
jgi:hypothetical protein